MRFFCPSVPGVALCLAVWFAATSALPLMAAEVSDEESARDETYRANLLTLDEERVVGQRLAYLYAQQHPPLKNVSAQTRLNVIAAQLRAGTDAPILNIQIIKSIRPEAVSFPPGYVFITTALLELTRTDDEVAAVIAHEMAHLARHHLARLIALALKLSPADRENFPTSVAIITGQATQFSFPPVLDEARLRYEMEADQLAARWLKSAGYRFTALSTLLDHLIAYLSPQARAERAALRARVASLIPLHSAPAGTAY